MKNETSNWLVTALFLLCYHGLTGQVWRADNGDGTYSNPILYADSSDPDVIRVGDDYYMTASSFNCTPGLPILHSIDLVNWSLINYALPRQYPEDRNPPRTHVPQSNRRSESSPQVSSGGVSTVARRPQRPSPQAR